MSRVAVPLLLAFVALLTFIYVITDRRRKRTHRQLREYEELLLNIQQTARSASDVDPSAALIDHLITDYRNKELDAS